MVLILFIPARTLVVPNSILSKPSQATIIETKKQIKSFLQNIVDTGVVEKLPEFATANFLNSFYEIKNKEGDIWSLRPLDIALEFDNHELLRLLIEKGVNRAACLSKPVILFSAIERKKNNCVKWLIEQGGVNIEVTDPFGRTPLMFAAFKNYEVAKLLLEKGAKIDLKDRYGKTAKDYASDSKNDQIKALFDVGEEIQTMGIVKQQLVYVN